MKITHSNTPMQYLYQAAPILVVILMLFIYQGSVYAQAGTALQYAQDKQNTLQALNTALSDAKTARGKIQADRTLSEIVKTHLQKIETDIALHIQQVESATSVSDSAEVNSKSAQYLADSKEIITRSTTELLLALASQGMGRANKFIVHAENAFLNLRSACPAQSDQISYADLTLSTIENDLDTLQEAINAQDIPHARSILERIALLGEQNIQQLTVIENTCYGL
jgi:hypothetical protein